MEIPGVSAISLQHTSPLSLLYKKEVIKKEGRMYSYATRNFLINYSIIAMPFNYIYKIIQRFSQTSTQH